VDDALSNTLIPDAQNAELQFTHVSEDDFRIVRDNLAGAKRSTRDRLVPYCVFTDPPLAHVGLSEGDAERQGAAVRVGSI
jgi:pyruvate/2-oxoglutarate dehydrogenase complex dihydrolipoamide dehydrogenase (E3) component